MNDLVIPLAMKYAWETLTEVQKEAYLNKAKKSYRIDVKEVKLTKRL